MSDFDAIQLARELLEHVLRVHPNDAALINRANALLESLEGENVDSAIDRGRTASRKGRKPSDSE